MSFSRRPAAGLATVGASVLAALALGGTPALAADLTTKAGHAIMTPTPGAGDQRGNPGYGDTAPETPGSPATAAPSTPAPAGSVKAATATTTATTNAPNRGRPGYSPSQSLSPSASPSVTQSLPSGSIKETPGTGVNSATAGPRATAGSGGQGVSSGTSLPVTGTPLGATLALGGLMVAGGATVLWYTRRRRNA